MRKKTYGISPGVMSYFKSIKKGLFCWGQKNGLIRPRPFIIMILAEESSNSTEK